MKNIIHSVLPLAEKWAPSQVEQLREVRKQLETETLKVTVLGDFKAGKSTLLNHLFLQQALLPTDVAESTAVPTVLCDGNPCMQLWKRDAYGAEYLVESVTDISAENLASYITADTDEQRLELSRRYSKVVLSQPGILPAGLNLVDTPGMNSTNVGIMISSMWEAHDADVVLYVVRARELSQRETELITEISGSQHNKVPFFVVLTSDGTQADGQLNQICDEIKAELSMRQIPCDCGVFHFPDRCSCVEASVVNMAKNLYKLFVSGEAQMIETTSGESYIDESPGSDIGSLTHENSRLKSRMLEFFSNNVGKGRRAKIIRNLLPILDEIRNAIRCRLALGDADAEKVKQAEVQLEYKKSEYERTISNLLGDVNVVQMKFIQLAAQGIDRARDQLKKELESKKSADEIFAETKLWKYKIPRNINWEIEAASIELEKDLQILHSKYSVSIEQQMSHTDGYEVSYDAGIVDRIPAWMVTLIDYLAFDFFSPLPFIADMGVRYLISKIPFLDKLTPTRIGANIARDIACKELDKIAVDVHNSVHTSMDSRFALLNAKLTADLDKLSPFAGEEDAIAAAKRSVFSQSARMELISAADRLGEWTQQLLHS